MKTIVAVLVAGALMGGFAASYAKLPAAPAKTEEQKKAEADKAAAGKAKDAADLAKAQDKAVANYKRHASAMGKGNPGKK
jgi:gas vesicle protein